MAVDLSEEWLKSLGVKATKQELEKLRDKANEELEWRIGDEIAQELTQQQLDEFEAIEDEDERLAWLEKAYPTYKKVVHAQYAKLNREIRSAKDKVAFINQLEHAD